MKQKIGRADAFTNRPLAKAFRALLLALILAVVPSASAQEHEMTTYRLVFVREGEPEEPVPERQVSRLATATDQYLGNLLRHEAMVIGGPIVGDEKLRQVFVLNVDSSDQAASILGHSPAVERGQHEVEVYAWWAAKNLLRRPPDADDRVDSILGLLKRPVPAPHFTEEDLQTIQEGHLANIRKMAESGDLVMAGPVEEQDDLRGILIFRTTDPARVRRLVAEDPAIKAGRLELELLRWQVPRGVFPAR